MTQVQEEIHNIGQRYNTKTT